MRNPSKNEGKYFHYHTVKPGTVDCKEYRAIALMSQVGR